MARVEEAHGTVVCRDTRLRNIEVEQWFLTFFSSWTPKSQKKLHGPLNNQSVLEVDP